MYRYFLYFFVEANQQALKRKDSNVHCGSIDRRNQGRREKIRAPGQRYNAGPLGTKI